MSAVLPDFSTYFDSVRAAMARRDCTRNLAAMRRDAAAVVADVDLALDMIPVHPDRARTIVEVVALRCDSIFAALALVLEARAGADKIDLGEWRTRIRTAAGLRFSASVFDDISDTELVERLRKCARLTLSEADFCVDWIDRDLAHARNVVAVFGGRLDSLQAFLLMLIGRESARAQSAAGAHR